VVGDAWTQAEKYHSNLVEWSFTAISLSRHIDGS